MKEKGILPDIVFTSLLRRAIRTAIDAGRYEEYRDAFLGRYYRAS